MNKSFNAKKRTKMHWRPEQNRDVSLGAQMILVSGSMLISINIVLISVFIAHLFKPN